MTDARSAARNAGPTFELRIVRHLADVALEAAYLFMAAAKDAVAARGRFTVALSGGNTPPLLFRLLSGDGHAAFRASIPWSRVHIFWGDERHVPPDAAASNYRMAKETLLDSVPVPSGQIHRMMAERVNAADAAREYEATLQTAFGLETGAMPVFDLMLLGMGPDGHTASIFPGSPLLGPEAPCGALVAAPWVESQGTFRLTLTPQVILASRLSVVLAAGASKAAMLKTVLEGPADPMRYPSQILRGAHGRVVWVADGDAASQLSPSNGAAREPHAERPAGAGAGQTPQPQD
jgi:6-phosphogluconolactonase